MFKNHQRYSKRHFVSSKIYAPDRIGLVGFHETAWIIAVPAEPHAAWLQMRTRELKSKANGKGTNITDAIRKGTEMLAGTPNGILRRLWLLTDGESNREESKLWDVVAAARDAYININTIGFGDKFDRTTLQRIAASTHNGKFIAVSSLRQLTDALIAHSRPHGGLNKIRHHHRAETTVVCIDLSASMTEPMDGKMKIEVVQEALDRLILYKQQVFS